MAVTACTDPESFVRGGPILITFYFCLILVDEGKEICDFSGGSGPPVPTSGSVHALGGSWLIYILCPNLCFKKHTL